MKIEPVQRYVPRNQVVIPFKTLEKAATEAAEYKFSRISKNHYACEHDGKVHIIILKGNAIGCSCAAMTFAHDNDVCKHIAAFLKRSKPPESLPSVELLAALKEAGWTGLSLTPPAATSDPDGERPEDAPKPVPPELGEKVWRRECPHCGKLFEGTDLDEIKREHQKHIAICSKRPKGGDTTQQEQKEETKMEAEAEQTVTAQEDKAEPNKIYVHPDGTQFESAEALLDYNEKRNDIKQMNETKALVSPAQTTSQVVMPSWTDGQLETMKKTVAEKATPAEFTYFLNVAAATGLNPFLKEIYFMKTDKGQTAIITGRDGYLTIAKRDPRFKGIQSMEVCKSDEFEMGFVDGRMEVTKHVITDFKDRGEIIGAWARGQMKNQEPVTIFASIKEYDKGGNIWQRYKSAMIRKVAESMVLKRIAGISGLVTEAEISDSNTMVLDAEVV